MGLPAGECALYSTPDHGRAPRDSRACPAVSEVDQHPDNEPADKPDPGRDVERNHHGETDEDACDGHPLLCRYSAQPGRFSVFSIPLETATLTSQQHSPWEGTPWPITHSRSRRPCATCPHTT